MQVHVSAPQVSLKDQQNSDASAGIVVKFDVTSGPQYNFNGITWSGNQAMTGDALTKAIDFKPGDLARQNKLDLAWLQVRHAYGKIGYLQAELDVNPEFDAAQHQVIFHAAIAEGPQYHMGELTISGVSEPLAAKLKAAWKLHPGDVYDDTYLKTYLQVDAPSALKAGAAAKAWAINPSSTVNSQTHVVNIEVQFR